MQKHLSSLFLYGILCWLLFSCNTLKKPVSNSTDNFGSLKLLSVYDIPFGFLYKQTTVGGLSGIDYDSTRNCYYLVCDDRSATNPARFYTAEIEIRNNKIDTIRFINVQNFLQPNGEVYPNSKHDPRNTPDPESMRYDPVRKQFAWGNEGERIINENDSILSNPSVRVVDVNGKFIDSFIMPGNMQMSVFEKGPRQNSVFEGMSYANNFKSLFINVEEPLLEDGPRADVTEKNAYIRILKFNCDSRKNIAQFAYKLDPIPYPAKPPGAYKINGVPDILAIDDEKLLVIERSFSSGRLACVVKLFLADLSAATDVSSIESLKANTGFKTVRKQLLMNMEDLGIYIDNIEGLTFGPNLPNGHRTILFVADNNFNPLERSQVLLFELTN